MYTCNWAANLPASGGLVEGGGGAVEWRETGDQWVQDVMEEAGGAEGREHHCPSLRKLLCDKVALPPPPPQGFGAHNPRRPGEGGGSS